MPALWGGRDGAAITRDLLSAGFGSAMLLISGYSNPASVLAHARSSGYAVRDFLVQPLPFGRYTSQDAVTHHLRDMRAQGTAFWRDGSASRRPYYFLAGVLFQRTDDDDHPHSSASGSAAAEADLTDELLAVLTAL